MSRELNTTHSAIFNYWKDKAITKYGNIVQDTGGDKERISVVRDWTMPRCFACCDSMRIDFNSEKFLNGIDGDLSSMWNYPEIKKHLNRCHIKPHAAGGNDKPRNLFLLCETCHIESPDTGNPKNFFRWVYKRRKRGLTINGFVISEFIEEFLQDCKEKNKDPFTLKPKEADIYSHGGFHSQSTLAMALADTCDNI